MEMISATPWPDRPKGLFLADEQAHDLSVEDLKGKLSNLTGKDQSVVQKMASTFKALAGIADFKQAVEPSGVLQVEEPVESPALEQATPRPTGLAFAHTVFINLPATREVAVYDAIFKGIREHLLCQGAHGDVRVAPPIRGVRLALR
jgi:uncharacterized protein DUF5343